MPASSFTVLPHSSNSCQVLGALTQPLCRYFTIYPVRDMEGLGKLLELIKVALEPCQLRLSLDDAKHTSLSFSHES